ITFYEDDLYGKEEVKEESVQLVVFRLSMEWYGVDINKTKEIVKVGTITYLPSAPDHIYGILNLRGNIMSITNLKRSFGLSSEELTERSRIVVIESGSLKTGLLVDEVEEIIEIPVSKIDPTLTTIDPERGECITGECRIDDKLVGVLNVGKILLKTGGRQ
ncbi:MAG: chemotaxis protein CheW, partial [Thermodesulfobacteriota bacterium]